MYISQVAMINIFIMTMYQMKKWKQCVNVKGVCRFDEPPDNYQLNL